jgi:glycosyltransferase involved in cell wall biosynthesis
MEKEIDLIIPAYKAHKTIFKTLCSIAEQSCSDKIKVTIVNDCCPQGNYKKIINIFKNNLDIQEIKMPKNGGPGAARQFGIDHTELPYVIFMDADDCLMGPYAVTQLLNFLEEKEEDVAFSGFVEEFLPNQYVMHLQDHI